MAAKLSNRNGLIYTVIALTGLALLAGVLQAKEARLPAGQFRVSIDAGQYSLEANEANMYDVLETLRVESGLDFLLDDRLQEETVSGRYENLGLEPLLQQLAESRALVYERDGETVRLVGAVITSQGEAEEVVQEVAQAASGRNIRSNTSRLGGAPSEYGLLSNTTLPMKELLDRNGPSALLMANAIIDTSSPNPSERSVAIPEAYRASDDTEYHIVQFDGRVTPALRRQVEDLGGKIKHYVPRNALAVQADAKTLAALGEADHVTHIEPFHPYLKMSRDLVDVLTGPGSEGARARVGVGRYNILMFQGIQGEELLTGQGVEVTQSQSSSSSQMLTVSCTPDRLKDLLFTEGVQWVEPAVRMKTLNDLANVTTTAARLKMRHPSLDGSGVIVGVTDSGVDFTHRGFSVDTNSPTSLGANSRILYYDSRPGPTSDGIPGDANGHGSHVAGSVLGNGALSHNTVNLVPGSGDPPFEQGQFAGIAPEAHLVMLEDFNSFSYQEQVEIAYEEGARLSNNSWGSSLFEYGAPSFIWDGLVRDADPLTAGNQEFIVFFAAGNDGGGQYDGVGGSAGTIGSPGNAKNVITVGAVEQLRNANNLPNAIQESDSDWQVASFSGRGPVTSTDPRVKPDIVAPGVYLNSVQTKDVDFDSFTDPFEFRRDLRENNVDTGTNYAFFAGTSMASPIATGSGALIYEYFTEILGRTPSPAMMKAVMVGGSRHLNTRVYSYPPFGNEPAVVYEGWGMVDLVHSVDGPQVTAGVRPIFLDQQDTSPVGTGETYTFQFTMDEKDGGFKITLAWTDIPGAPVVNPKLVNDIDLVVRAPDGTGWVGNYFDAQGLHSDYFDDPDLEFGDQYNNVEVVLVPDPMPGTYTVEVFGWNVPVGPQDFALVVAKGEGLQGATEGRSPSMDLDEDGHPVVAFVDEDDNGQTQIFLKRWFGTVPADLGPLGTWARMERQWFGVSTSMRLTGVSQTVEPSLNPDVAVQADDLFVAWEQESSDTNVPTSVYLRMYDGGAGEWKELGSSARWSGISTNSTFAAVMPSVAAGPDGMPVVAYRQNTETTPVIKVTKWNGISWVDLGGSWSNKLPGSIDSTRPDVAIDSLGRIVVAWTETSGATGARIHVRRWNGSSWEWLGAVGDAPNAQQGSVAIGPDDHIYLSYQQFPNFGSGQFAVQVLMKRYDGSAWSGIAGSGTYPGISNINYLTDPEARRTPVYPTLDVNESGIIMVGWQQTESSPSNAVRVVGYRPDTGSWANVPVNPGLIDTNLLGVSQFAQTGVDKAGFPIVTFQDNTEGPEEILTYTVVSDREAPFFAGLGRAVGGTNNNVLLSWLPASDPSQPITYHVYRSTVPFDCGGEPNCDPVDIFANEIATTADTTYDVTGLVAGKVYCFAVRAEDGVGLVDENEVIRSAGPVAGSGDLDGDCLDNLDEVAAGTEVCVKDTDEDGMWDGWEWAFSTNNPTPANPLYMDPLDNGLDHVGTLEPNDGDPLQLPDEDLDGDGASNYEEFAWWLNHTGGDCDIVNTATDPTNPDTDGDGIADGWEMINDLDPTDPTDTGDDPDGDGLDNLGEFENGGDPKNPDSDGDGLNDGDEAHVYGTRVDLADSDRDGLDDGFELIETLSDPLHADHNGDLVMDGVAYQLLRDPTDAEQALNVLLCEDFETATRDDWATSAPNPAAPFNLWHLSTAEPQPKTENAILIDDHTPTTSYRVADDPTGSDTNATYNFYNSIIICDLVSPVIDATGTTNLNLTWVEFIDTEQQHDRTRAFARGGGRLDWTPVSTVASGQSDGWVRRTADMSAFAGFPDVQVRFLFQTANGENNHFRGWYVDDVCVYEGTTIHGWVRDVNGAPVEGASVWAMGSGGVTNVVDGHVFIRPGVLVGNAMTAKDGTFAMNGLPQGSYYVKADGPGHIAEFYNGQLFTPPYGFGAGLNPGVPSRDEVTAGGLVDQATSGAHTEVNFELAPGQGRICLGVSAAGTFPVQVNSLEAMVWNGDATTGGAAFVAYETDPASELRNRMPDWETNPVRPELLCDIDAGPQRPYAVNTGVLYPQPLIETREGEISRVIIATNQSEGRLFVRSENDGTYPIWIDGIDSGEETPSTLSIKAGAHVVRIIPADPPVWIAQREVVVPSGRRAIVTFTEEDFAATPGALRVRSVDIFNDPVTGATIYVDGMLIASNEVLQGGSPRTPATVMDLQPGPHSVAVWRDGYKQPSYRTVRIPEGGTIETVFVMYQADEDYDQVGDGTEAAGYTNLFLFSRSDDPDADGLDNLTEFEQFWRHGIALNVFDPDTDADLMLDGEELGYDDLPGVLALSRLYTNAIVQTPVVEIEFTGEYLAGFDHFDDGTLWPAIECDRFDAGAVDNNAPSVPTTVAASTLFTDIPDVVENERVSTGHALGARVLADGLPDTVDTDGDGLWDGFEFLYGLGTPAMLDVIDCGRMDEDPDGDGLINMLEFLGLDGEANTNDWINPGNPDSDGDGMPDGWEYGYGFDPINPDNRYEDADGDGVLNVGEFLFGSNPLLADTDGDFLPDGAEVAYGSDPNLVDTDLDGLVDGREVWDRDLDGEFDGGFFNIAPGNDLDGDGYADGPADWDTDGDGMPDGFEVLDVFGNELIPLDPGCILDPYNNQDADRDCDGDGLSNLQEFLVQDALYGNHPSVFNPLFSSVIWDLYTDPFKADTDGDGFPDGWEVRHGLHPYDPIPDQYDTTPGVDHPDDPPPTLRYGVLAAGGDLDGDGLWNMREFLIRFSLSPDADDYAIDDLSTHPWIPDTDGDGLGDGEEDRVFGSHPLNQDTDGDRLLDGVARGDYMSEVESLARFDPEFMEVSNHLDQAQTELWMLRWSPAEVNLPFWERVDAATGLIEIEIEDPNDTNEFPGIITTNVPNPITPRWANAMAYIPVYEADDQGVLLDNRQLVVVGGNDGVSRKVDMWQFPVANNTWLQMPGAIFDFPPVGGLYGNGLAEAAAIPTFYTRGVGRMSSTLANDRTYFAWGWDTDHGYEGSGPFPLLKTADVIIPVSRVYTNDTDAFEAGGEVFDNRNLGGTEVLFLGEAGTNAWDATGIHFNELTSNEYSTISLTAEVTFVFLEPLPEADVELVIQAEFNVNENGSLGDYTGEDGATPLERLAGPPHFASSGTNFTILAGTGEIAQGGVTGTSVDVTSELLELMADDRFYRTQIGFVITPADDAISAQAVIAENQTLLTITSVPNYIQEHAWLPPDITQISINGGDAVRKSAPIAWDYNNSVMVSFGGLNGNDVLGWTYEGTFTPNPGPPNPSDANPNVITWERVDTFGSPPARYDHCMVYDRKNDRIVVFGGFGADHKPLNDLWIYSVANNLWLEIAVYADSQVPMPRGGASMIYFGDWDYDRLMGDYCIYNNHQELVLFGGTDGKTYFNDTWVYDSNMNRWRLASLVGEHSQNRPSPRAFAQFVYAQNALGIDPGPNGCATAAAFLFGGRTGPLPTGLDADSDGLDDGLEFELSRDPRVNALWADPETSDETVPYAYKRIGTVGGPATDVAVGAIANLEAQSWLDRFTIAPAMPIQGHPVDHQEPFLGKFWQGVDAWIPQYSSLWWHQFGGENPYDPRDVWELGVPDNQAIGATAAPPYAHSGRWCYSTDRNGTYPNDARMDLYSPLFDLVSSNFPSSGSGSDTDVWETVEGDILDFVMVDGENLLPIGDYTLIGEDGGPSTNGTHVGMHFPNPPVIVPGAGSVVQLVLDIETGPAADLQVTVFVEFDPATGHSSPVYNTATGSQPSARTQLPYISAPTQAVIPAELTGRFAIDISAAYELLYADPLFDGSSIGIVIADAEGAGTSALLVENSTRLGAAVAGGDSLWEGVGPFYLEFFEWLDLADGNDTVFVELIRPKTSSETQNRKSSPAYPPQVVVPPRNHLSNTDGEWRRMVVPLDLFMGETNAFLRFSLLSDEAGVAGGWYIDDIALYQAGSISGMVTRGGAPLGGAEVNLLGTNVNQNVNRTTLSAPDGSYQLGPLPLGSYKVQAGDSVVAVELTPEASTGAADLAHALSVAIVDVSGVDPIEITWAAIPGMDYRIESADALLPEPVTWTTLDTVTAAGIVETYPVTPGPEETKLYRVVLVVP